MHELAEQLLASLKTIWRNRWYAIAFAWIFALVGWTVVYKMPNRYEAYARVYVDTQSVLKPLLSGITVDSSLDQMVSIMSRTLTSRSNLEKVIRMAGLDEGLKSDKDWELLVTRLTLAISVKSAGRDFYTISCVDKDPQTAKRIVQSLLTMFVEGSIVSNRKDSDSARDFIDQQLEGDREKLVAAENAVTEFKRRNLGLMPGQGSGYFARLDETKSALKQAMLDLKEAENSRDSIKKSLAIESEMPSVSDDKIANEGSNTETVLDIRIRSLGQKLDELRTIYTEQHPDVVATVHLIEQLKEQREAESKQKQDEARLKRPLPTATQHRNLVYQQLTVSLTAVEASVAAMKARVAEYAQRYAELKTAANAVPRVEAEFVQLTRDYEVTRARYDELLKRRESARISEDVNTSNAAEAFRVIDPPQVPVLPSSPKRRLLMTAVLILAIAGGLGIAFLIGQAKPTFSDERKLRELTGLRVLGTVAMAWTDSQRTQRKRDLITLLLSFASLLSAYAAFMVVLVLTASRV